MYINKLAFRFRIMEHDARAEGYRQNIASVNQA